MRNFLKRASPIVGIFNCPKSRYALKPICRGQQKGSWFSLVQAGSRIGLRRENSQNAFKLSVRPVERLLGFKGTLYRVSPQNALETRFSCATQPFYAHAPAYVYLFRDPTKMIAAPPPPPPALIYIFLGKPVMRGWFSACRRIIYY